MERSRSFGALGAAVLALAVAARIAVPVPEALGGVPITGQSSAALIAGALLGPRRGALAAAAYIALAAVGAPVLAEGRGGWDAVRGSSAGYLAGFVLGATAAGALSPPGRPPHLRRELAAQLAGTTLILLCGWARLAALRGVGPAYAGGVEPFLIGGCVKVVFGALLVHGLRRLAWRRRKISGSLHPRPGSRQ